MTSEQYGEAYTKGFAKTVRSLRSIGVQRDLAEECAQKAWVRGWQKIHQLRDPSIVVAWVHEIASKMFLMELRSPLVRLRDEMPDEVACACNPKSIEDPIDCRRLLSMVHPKYRALLLRVSRGEKTEVIAREEGLDPTSIRVRLLRARRDIRDGLSRAAKNGS